MTPETLDEFLKSTCVIVVFAYLLTRRPLRAVGWLGAVFGVAGLIELWVARDRSPYDTYTLIITFVALRFGARVGGIAALVVGLGAPLFLREEALMRTWIALAVSLAAGLLVRRALPPRRTGLACFLAVILAEAGAIAARSLLHGQSEIPFAPQIAVLKIVANGLGALVLQTVLGDAEAHARAESLRVEVERGKTLLAESRLAALQARVHPHFLFNALNSIAALCRLAPLQAEKAVVQLGVLMRRALESSPRTLTSLRDELDAVDGYLELEGLRLGARLRVEREIDSACLDALAPPFALQTLVENAILHGIGPRPEPGTLWIRIVRRKSWVLICVADDGLGMTCEALSRARADWDGREGERPHGLQLAREQLVLLQGKRSRLRVFSQENHGTLALFVLPLAERTRP